MNKLFTFFIGLAFTTTLFGQDPVLMEINDSKVTKSEFLQIYLKNNNDPKYDKASLDEYMELFKKFKLKVAEAEALGYDTIPSLVKELAGYKEQLALPYLVDSAKNNELVNQAYERLGQEIRASHILIRVNENASPEDTLKAYKKIVALKKKIEEGADFETVAKAPGGSEDPSVAQNGGDLGYFTAFQMVYPFENAAYNTKVGEISDVVRTNYGYHILKVKDKRTSRGTISAAHIMVVLDQKATKSDMQAAEEKINQIYSKLKAGEDFATLAQQYSDDVTTKNKGGNLPLFGSGSQQRMVPIFEDMAFALKNDGDYSVPFQTNYGWHIVKRNELNSLRSIDDLRKELQNKVNRDVRGQSTQASFITKLKDQYDFKSKASKTMKYFYEDVDSTIFEGNWDGEISKKKTMFELDDKEYMTCDFAKYLQENQRKQRKQELKPFLDNMYATFEKETIINYEKSKLEEKYPDFKALMQEYHDGVLLYEVMKDKVWDKAVRDTSGLKAFYEANKSNYMFPDRIQATIYETYDVETANKVNALAGKGLSADSIQKVINAESQLNLKVFNGVHNPQKMDAITDRPFKTGVNPVYKYNDKFYTVVKQDDIPAQPKTLKEAKGSVIQDYQNKLEADWLNTLAQTHKIVVHEDVLYSFGK